MTKSTCTSAEPQRIEFVTYHPTLTCEHGTFYIEERCPDCEIECPETYHRVLALVHKLT